MQSNDSMSCVLQEFHYRVHQPIAQAPKTLSWKGRDQESKKHFFKKGDTANDNDVIDRIESKAKNENIK